MGSVFEQVAQFSKLMHYWGLDYEIKVADGKPTFSFIPTLEQAKEMLEFFNGQMV